MTIASEITRIRAAKAALMTAINSKGGTLTASQLLGDYAPAVDAIQTGGGATSFYQCASVDTAAGTWTGYKWEWDDTEGEYILSSSLTSDPLTIEGFKPIVGKTYSGNTRESADMWEGSTLGVGLVFYAPLASASETAETGQALTITGTVSYDTVDGIPCCKIDSTGNYITAPDTSVPSGTLPRTIACWIRPATATGSATAFGYGEYAEHRKFTIDTVDGVINGARWNGEIGDYSYTINRWLHVIFMHDGTTSKLFIDGVENATSDNLGVDTSLSGSIVIGCGVRFTDEFFTGCIAGCRIYNRALTAEEITQLANEFTPTA